MGLWNKYAEEGYWIQKMSPAERAFRRGLVALLPRLRRFAMALTGSSDAADDLLQTALERGLRSAHSFDPERRLDSWMFKIVQNAWADKRRELASHEFLALDDGEDSVGPSIDERAVLEARDELRKVDRAFAQLPEEQRVVLTLVVLEGFSYRDAAETLNVPIGTVMSRLARGRAAIVHAVRPGDAISEVKGTNHG